eukprot:Em0003g1686a
MGVDEVIPHKLQKALTFCNKKLGDMRSEERRRLFGVQPCQGFLKMKAKDFAERFLSTYKVNLDNLDIYTKHLALLRTFTRNVESMNNTYQKFGKWISTIFHGDPSADDLNDTASNEELFDYDTSSSALESTLTELSTPF